MLEAVWCNWRMEKWEWDAVSETQTILLLLLSGDTDIDTWGWGFYLILCIRLKRSMKELDDVLMCPTLCNPMNRSTPGLPVHHQLLEFTQTHVHWVGDAIQPSHPLLSTDEIVGWHHQLDGRDFEQALAVDDGQGGLACCSPWDRKELDMTEQLNWTDPE